MSKIWFGLVMLWISPAIWAADLAENSHVSVENVAPQTTMAAMSIYEKTLFLLLELQEKSSSEQQKLWQQLPKQAPALRLEDDAQLVESLRFFMIKALFSQQIKSNLTQEMENYFAPALNLNKPYFSGGQNHNNEAVMMDSVRVCALQNALRLLRALDQIRQTNLASQQNCTQKLKQQSRKNRILVNQLERLQAIEKNLSDNTP